MRRVFQNMKTGDLIYLDDMSEAYEEFKKKIKEKDSDEYQELFFSHSG